MGVVKREKTMGVVYTPFWKKTYLQALDNESIPQIYRRNNITSRAS